MRYSLRSLLFGVALSCIYAAWTGYLRQQAAHHRQESSRIIQELAKQQEMKPREVETLVVNIASKSFGRVDNLRFNVQRFPEISSKLDDLERNTAKAANHEILARNFEKTMWQPWNIVNARFSP